MAGYEAAMNISVRSARRASDSSAMEGLARWGLGARAFLYVVLGLLAGAIALGRSHQEADQQGALSVLSQQSGGKVLLVLVAIGLFGYALWRLSEAAFGVAGDHGKGPRLQSLVRGILYTGLGVTTLTVLHSAGTTKSQTSKQQSASATLLQHTGGRLLLGVVGVIVVVVGLVMISDGVRKKFLKFLRTSDMSAQQRKVVELAGTLGTCARGAIFALAGGLVVEAAARRDAHKASGLDGALRTLAAQPYGKTLLLIAAAGLVIFGLYGFAEARWHKT
jgi:hypothetical protein